MEPLNDHHLKNRISWGSIIAGLFIVMAVSLLLSVLGTGLGISMMSFQSDDVLNGADTMVIVWWIVSVTISLFVGAFIAGKLAGRDGMIHGVLVWATSLVIATLLGILSAGSMVSMIGSTFGSIASATGNVAQGVGSAAGSSLGKTFDAGHDILKQMNINVDIPSMNLDQKAIQALKNSNVPSLQPEFFKSQLSEAKQDVMHAVKEVTLNPGNSDNIINGLMDKLKNRSDTINQSISREDVAKAISANSSYNPQEALKLVDNVIDYRKKAVAAADDKLAELKDKLNQTQQQIAEFKSKVGQKMDGAAKAIAHMSIWCFISLLLGAIVSAVGGYCGVYMCYKYGRRHDKHDTHHHDTHHDTHYVS